MSIDLSDSLRFGAGRAIIDPQVCAPIAFMHEASPDRRYLLDASLFWHTFSHYWGMGHATTDYGAALWCTPIRRSVDKASGRQGLEYDLAAAGLALTLTRTPGSRLTERYVWRNITGKTVTINGLGVQTPFGDWYPGSSRSLAEGVNAHVFTGGAWSWALAVPMNGTGQGKDPSLGLIVREGGLASYSIESRNENLSSNARGHIVLQVTDYARNPGAFGGQPLISLEPGEFYVLCWELGWYESIEQFLVDTRAPAQFSAYAATVGDPITVATDRPVYALSKGLKVDSVVDGYRLGVIEQGTYRLQIGDGPSAGRTEVLFHAPLKEQVVSRCEYIRTYQRAIDRPGTLAGAFIPIDVRTRLRVDDSGWADWTDGSERIAMPVLLQSAVNRGWLDEDAQPQIDAWADFAREWLIDPSGLTSRGSSQPADGTTRLYDHPWMADFFVSHYHATKDPADLDLAVLLLERMAGAGGERFLAINFAEVSEGVAAALEECGRAAEAQSIRGHVLRSAEYFLGVGSDLPSHEVKYEQSIVAPLVNLLISAHRLTGDPKYLAGIKDRLPWLLAFSGPQPDSRLNGIAIRHWDGYWFGLNRQFGDAFPHHWSALTATALARLPRELRSESTDALALAIMRANMANYYSDGSATCAYLFPSSVGGQPAGAPDPLANDQDWHLVIWLHLLDEEGFTEV